MTPRNSKRTEDWTYGEWCADEEEYEYDYDWWREYEEEEDDCEA